MKNRYGTVYLVGGGPGDPELLTLKAKRLLQEADAVVFDSLAPREALLFASQAVKIDVGKRGGKRESVRQAAIHRMLFGLAKKYKKVVRLKGGDPFVFGRGGEEALFLAGKKVRCEIVPGVTAAFGAAAACKIPLTHRGLVSEVLFITAREAVGKKGTGIHWKEAASGNKTLVFYMGVRALPVLISKLLSHGMSGKTPAAIIQSATMPEEKIVEGNLRNLLEKARASKIESPSLVLIGAVVGLRKCFEKKTGGPLSGKCVLVTRTRPQASELSSILRSLGARVLEFPLIRIGPPASWALVDREIQRMSRYDWVLFTSANGVEMFFSRLSSKGKDARVLGNTKVGAIGPATAAKLAECGIKADLIPRRFVSESLAEDLISKEKLRGKKVLLARAEEARNVLRKELERKGARVKELSLYRVFPAGEESREIRSRLENNGIDLVTFASSSTVRNFEAFAGRKTLREIKSRVRFASIGPVTTRTIKSCGLSVACEAKQYTVKGLATAIERYYRERGGG